MTDALEPWPARGAWPHRSRTRTTDRRGGGHDDTSTARLDLPPTVQAPALARRFVRATLTRWGFCEDGVDAAQLVVTELTANAVVHTGTTDVVSLSVSVAGDRVTVGLTDGSSIPPVVAALTDDGESGRGMSIVNRVAEAWGTAERQDGKQVWARLRLPRRAHGSNL